MGSEAKHAEVRAACVAYMDENSDYFSLFLPDTDDDGAEMDFEGYLDSMRSDGEWEGIWDSTLSRRTFLNAFFIHQLEGPMFEISPGECKESKQNVMLRTM